jgi:hypothetical protein
MPQRRGCICFALALLSGRGRVNCHSTANLPLPPPCALPSTSRGCCSLAKPPRGACGPSRTALQPPSMCNRSATPPGLAHVAVGCSISSAPHASAPLLYTRTPSPYSPAASHFQHSALAPLSRGNAARPLPLPSPAQHTRRCARNNAALAAKAAMNLFQKPNET